MISHLSALSLLRLFLALAGIAGASLARATPPHIVVIVSDDQGYGELSAHGNPIVRTPHLDRLHASSVRLTDFHAAPMCTPTRAQLMTGRDAVRTHAVNVSSGRSLLRRDVQTLPELLRAGGYTTGLFGKWHLGDNYPCRPQDRGFDEVMTFPSSHIGSVPDAWLNDYFDGTYLHNGRARTYPGYTTDVLFDEAMAWIKHRRSADRPTFTYVATAAPHAPHYVPERFRTAMAKRLEAALPSLPKLTSAQQESITRYLAMVENLDENMGRLDAFLEKEGLRNDTLLVFLSDNGTTFGDLYYPAGMRGKKTTLWEGGHRVPCFLRWPAAGLGAPREVTPLTQVQDLLPTLLECAGLAHKTPADLDGRSLAPLLLGATAVPPERTLFINFSRVPFPGKAPWATSAEVRREGTAVLWQQWRWLEDRQLFDLKTDPLQQHDVAAQYPEVVARLRGELDHWWRRVGPDANEPERVVLGHVAENPALLTACEWWNVFVDQQAQVRRGELKNGVWHVEFAHAGNYRFELRRWPRDASLGLTAGAPPAKLADDQLQEGKALPIAQARLRIAEKEWTAHGTPEATHLSFELPLPAGPAQMEATFLDASGAPLLGAYYVYVERR